MIIKQATEEILANITEGKFVLDFYATWCGPCQMISTIFDQITEEEVSNDVTLVKVNVEDFPELAGQYSVLNVPTLVVLDNGIELRRNSGFMPKPVLVEFINR